MLIFQNIIGIGNRLRQIWGNPLEVARMPLLNMLNALIRYDDFIRGNIIGNTPIFVYLEFSNDTQRFITFQSHYIRVFTLFNLLFRFQCFRCGES